MTAKEDKKTPARVGRVPGLILAQRWGRPSLAGGVLRNGLWNSALLLFRCRILSLFERTFFLIIKDSAIR